MVRQTSPPPDNVGMSQARTFHNGWVAGAGTEIPFAGNWTATLEYLYSDFGRQALTFEGGAQRVSANFNEQSLRVVDHLENDGRGLNLTWEVRDAIARLRPEHRAVVGLVLVEGLSYEEAADTLALPVGTVTSRLARAREALQQMLGEWP